MKNKIFRVSVKPGSALMLRAGPTTASTVVARLPNRQAVARLDDVDHDGWYFLFADTPGDGLYVGYASARHLAEVNFSAGESEVQPIDTRGDDASLFSEEAGAPDRNGPEDPPREPDDAGPSDAAPTPAPPARPRAGGAGGWHPRVPEGYRHASPNRRPRRSGARAEHVVLHITGTSSLQSVINTFMKGNRASAHYLVTQAGEVHQFVPEHETAWHAGVKSYVQRLYNTGDWRQYKRYFGGKWAQRHYPDGVSVFCDSHGNPLRSKSGASLVRRKGGGDWSDYQYFNERWGRGPMTYPVGYSPGGLGINDTSIGIEILSTGAKTKNPKHYSDDMYATLALLIEDICNRNGLEKSRETVVGHEDVNPVERWGWDPNQGFDWARALDTDALVRGLSAELNLKRNQS